MMREDAKKRGAKKEGQISSRKGMEKENPFGVVFVRQVQQGSKG